MANNRVQQRFDKSIRQAVATTASVKAAESAGAIRKRQDRARREIPHIEKLISEGKTSSGAVLSKADIKELRAMLDHRQKLISVEVPPTDGPRR